MIQQRNVSNGQQNSYFRWTEFPIGKPEEPQRVGSQVSLDGKHQERHQHSKCNGRMYVSRDRQPAHEKKRGNRVGDVVNIEPIAGPFEFAKARERAIQAIPQPVQSDEYDSRQQGPPMPGGQGITDSSHALRQEAQYREMVRVDPPRGYSGEPEQ